MTDIATTQTNAPVPFKLRLLQTTDLHMHLLPYDYARAAPSADIGLARLASRITALQADDVPTLLFDTGDFIQGSPLADDVIQHPHAGPHPISTAFNTLHYDAIAIGNHDFDYGTDILDQVIADLNCPVLCANVIAETATKPFAATTLIPVQLSDTSLIHVGVIGLCTPLVGLMDKQGRNTLSATPPQIAAQKHATALKAQGADVVVALCHFGIDPDDTIENVAADIAKIAQIDVVMAGHTHTAFPNNSQSGVNFINSETGTIHGKPVVMAGAFGQSLGAIELELTVDDTKTTIRRADVTVIDPDPTDQQMPDTFRTFEPMHHAALGRMSDVIAETTCPLSTVFSLIQPDLSLFLLAEARRDHMQRMIAGLPDAQLPMLSTAAPFRTGSRNDPEDYIIIPAGPITRTDVMAIYPFQNAPVALRRNGQQIKDWLEDSALLFRQLRKGVTLQPLIDPHIPPYRFDTIFGLTYKIDVTAPAGQRVTNIKHNGQPIDVSDTFVLVTSTNRLNQGQNIPPHDIICIAQDSSQDILAQSLQAKSPISTSFPCVWSFESAPQTMAQIYTCPNAKITDTQRNLRDDGLTTIGFRQFTLNFAP